MDTRAITKAPPTRPLSPENSAQAEKAETGPGKKLQGKEPAGGSTKTTREKSYFKKFSLTPYYFILPGVILLLIWVYYPLILTFWYSFNSGNLTKGVDKFVGIDNYVAVIGLPEFQQSIINTGLYIVGLIPLTVFIPLGIALLLSKIKGPMQTFYRSVLLPR